VQAEQPTLEAISPVVGDFVDALYFATYSSRASRADRLIFLGRDETGTLTA
jgi:hypothetical protein